MNKYFVFGLLYFLFMTFSSDALAQNLRLSGAWKVSHNNFQIEAGDDIPGTIRSDADQISLSVNGNVNKSNWVIRVHMEEYNTWNNNLELWVRRTGNGVGSGSVYGGNTFQRIARMETDFFSGQRVVNNIDVQYELRGATVLIPASNYQATIFYTLYED